MVSRNCWEIKHCGRQKGGEHSQLKGVCPAAEDQHFDGINNGKNGGRICWAVAGTFCGGEVQGTFAQKLSSCVMCDFFRQVKLQEQERFLMHPPLDIKRARRTENAPE